MRTKRPPDPRDFLPLTPAIAHILLALADEDRHGYAVMREVERITGGAVRMGPGTLYGTIKRLLGDGLIEETTARKDADVSEERRRYYRLTAKGQLLTAALFAARKASVKQLLAQAA